MVAMSGGSGGASNDQAGASAQAATGGDVAPPMGGAGTSGTAGAAGGPTTGGNDAAVDPPMLDPDAPLSTIPPECKGFEVLGLQYSPGGSTLPNICAPFDGTFNNPYAIRCIDADPSYETGYLGDEYCILPPLEELGTQIHIGPDSYDDAGEFELAPNVEISNFYYVNAPNPAAHYYYRSNWRMRPGAHHMLIALQDQDQADGWRAFGDMGSDFGGGGRSFGGAQRASVDRPQNTLEVPPENAGLGEELAAGQQFSFNLHHINTSGASVLREVWVNVWYEDEQDVTKPIGTFADMGSPADMSVPAGERVQRHYACATAGDTRIISLYGHYHAHGVHFSAWVERASGERVPVYDSFDWEDIPVYQYDSISNNPPANVGSGVDGAMSGILMLAAGDALHFECDINNDSDTALRFADEAITGEMCILFGSFTGADPCVAVQRVN
jgi:hypothetical protein